MNQIRPIIALLFIFMFLFIGGLNAQAMDTGLSIVEINPTEKETFLSEIWISRIDTEPYSGGITCFDVNENGWIAVVYTGIQIHTVGVYNAQAEFEYGYRFEAYGDVALEWSDDNVNINIYFVRGSMALELTPSAEIIDVCKIEDSRENDRYWDNVVSAKRKMMANKKYIMKNDGVFDVLSMSYAKLMEVDIDGNTRVIYDATLSVAFQIIVIAVLVLFGAVLVGVVLYKNVIKLYQNRKQG